ncbi:hypothetical protein CR513_17314, partial [Mucuna pruriens]
MVVIIIPASQVTVLLDLDLAKFTTQEQVSAPFYQNHEEEAKRFDIFQMNLNHIRDMNANRKSPHSHRLNKYADITPQEFSKIYMQDPNDEYVGCQVFGQTATSNHHEELTKIGINPSLKWTDQSLPQISLCDFLCTALPILRLPWENQNYRSVFLLSFCVVDCQPIKLAASFWNGEGSLLFTYQALFLMIVMIMDCNHVSPVLGMGGITIYLDSPVVPIGRSPRTDVLLEAENIVLEFGGSVLRLSRLYISFSEFSLLGRALQLDPNIGFQLPIHLGAHAYWLEKGIVESRPDHILNLIHYGVRISVHLIVLMQLPSPLQFCRNNFVGGFSWVVIIILYPGYMLSLESSTIIMDTWHINMANKEMKKEQNSCDHAPASWDWSKKGSGWVFSAKGAIEAINAIVTGNLVSLSQQELVDCVDKSRGCYNG